MTTYTESFNGTAGELLETYDADWIAHPGFSGIAAGSVNGELHLKEFGNAVNAVLQTNSLCGNRLTLSAKGFSTPYTDISFEFIKAASSSNGVWQDTENNEIRVSLRENAAGSQYYIIILRANGTWNIFNQDTAPLAGGNYSHNDQNEVKVEIVGSIINLYWGLDGEGNPIPIGSYDTTGDGGPPSGDYISIFHEANSPNGDWIDNFVITDGLGSNVFVVADGTEATAQAGEPIALGSSASALASPIGVESLGLAGNASADVGGSGIVATVAGVSGTATTTSLASSSTTLDGPTGVQATGQVGNPSTAFEDLDMWRAVQNGSTIPSTNMTIQGDQLELAVSGERAVVDSGAADHVIELEWTLGTGENRFIVSARSDATDSDAVWVNIREPENDVAYAIRTGGTAAGSTTQPLVTDLTPGQTYLVRVECDGPQIRIYIDDVLQRESTVTDHASLTYVGVGTAAITTPQLVDDFIVRRLPDTRRILFQDGFKDEDGTLITAHTPTPFLEPFLRLDLMGLGMPYGLAVVVADAILAAPTPPDFRDFMGLGMPLEQATLLATGIANESIEAENLVAVGMPDFLASYIAEAINL